MSTVLPILIFFHIFAQTNSVKFSTVEKRMIVDLSKNFAINHCVVISSEQEKSFDFIKYLSESNMQTGFMTINQINSSFYRNRRVKINKPNILVVLDAENFNESLAVIFNYYNEYHLSKYVWVIFYADEEILNETYIPYNCEFLNVKKLDKNYFEIFELYHTLIFATDLSELFYGVWTENNGLVISAKDFYSKRLDLNGTLLNAVTDYLPERCTHPGICAYQEMVSEMSRVMNFRVSYISTIDFNKLMKNNETYFPELDVSLYIMHYFAYSNAMVAPIWKTPAFLHIAYRKQYERGATSAHIKPLKPRVWMAIIIWIVTSGICVLITKYLMYKMILKQKFIWTNHLFLSLDSFTNQCGCKIPNITAIRISVIMTRLVPLLVLSVYSATLLSFVKVRSIQLPFEDIEGLVEDGTFKMGFENGTFLSWFLKMTNDPILKIAYEKYIAGDMPRGLINGTNRTCNDHKFAFMYFNNDVYRYERKCKILQIPKSVVTAWDAFDLRYNSPFKKIMNKILKTLRSAGILKKMEKFVYGEKPPITPEGQDSVDLESISLIYKIFLFIYVLAVIILMFECMIYVRTIKKKRKRV